MRKAVLAIGILLSLHGMAWDVNTDEGKVGPYSLENPLAFSDGRPVKTLGEWRLRRQEILETFAREMFGRMPPPPETLTVDLADERVTAGGFAIRRQYSMWFTANRSGPQVNWIVWIPRFARHPVPVCLFLNFNGNHELVPDADIPLMKAMKRRVTDDQMASLLSVTPDAENEALRGRQQDPNNRTVFPLGMILARGYAVMSACYCEVSPDPSYNEADPSHRQDPFAYTGVFSLWGPRDPARTDEPTSLGAWAWALSRGLDLAERMPEVDARRGVVTGYSRLAKAALLAAARDERFAVCVPVQTGGGGVPLMKRNFGETVKTMTEAFTHWYCKAYRKYADDPAAKLPFDQHLLLATLAPRALLVAGFDDPWYDTKGEFLAVRAASPVWRFLGCEGLPAVEWPEDYSTAAIGRRLGYVRRTEKHGISVQDWVWLLDFSDGVFADGK